MIHVEFMVVGPVSTNCYFLINDELKEVVIVDPGDRADRIEAYIAKEGLKPVAILLTHGHFDHMMAAEELREAYKVPVYACAKEKQLLNSASLNLAKGFIRSNYTMDADIYCKEGDEFYLAGCTIKVLETPGHTPGGCCYYIAEEDVVFTGDTLFAQSVGRTDFPGGSMSQIVRSIREKLMTLNKAGNLETDIMVYPGHNDPTTIETERMENPYL